MNHNHETCIVQDRNLCHLSPAAAARYLELLRGGCPEQAEDLRARGVWS